MFKIDSSTRVEVPIAFGLLADGEAVYRCAEILGQHPIWLLQVRSEADDGEIWFRQFLAADIRQACAILDLDIWTKRSLYAIFPPHLAGGKSTELLRCLVVDECLEPDSEQSCWRITTTRETVLHSYYGTGLGEERIARCLWRDQV